jgi:tetratricopeptide (TPR) repeat protein
MDALRTGLSLIVLTALVGCKADPKIERDRFVASAEQHFREKRYEEAVIQYRNALQKDDSHAPTYLGLGKAFQRQGDHANAIGAFRKVAELDGKNVEARLQLGAYYLTGGQLNPELFKKAQQIAEEVLALDSASVDARILLGNAYAGLNDLEKSAEEIERALAGDPENLTAALNMGAVRLRQKDPVGAEATYKAAIEKHPTDAKAHLALGAFYVASARAKEAEPELRKAFELAPAEPTVLYGLTGLYLSQKRDGDAEQVFKEALAKQPDSRPTRWGLANFYIQRKQFDAALATLQEMTRRDRNDREAEVRIAEVYVGLKKKLDDADKILHGVLERNPNYAEAHYIRGKSLKARNQPDKALAEFDAAIRLKEWLPGPYVERANLLAVRGDLEGAQTALNEVLRRNKNNLTARGALAKVLALRQRPQDALQEAADVLSSAPENEDALAAQGEAFWTLGRFKESKEILVKLCAMRPEYGPYWHRLAVVEATGGDLPNAVAHLRKAIDLRPDYSPASPDLRRLHLEAKKPDDALAELDRLQGSSVPKDEIHMLRGRVLLSVGKVEAAEAEYRRAIEANADNSDAHLALGQLHLERKNLKEAVTEVDSVLKKNDRSAPAYLLKGFYLQVAGDTSGAMAAYRKATELDPKNAQAANNLAWLLCESNGSLDEALSLAQTARRRAPDNPEIADTLGWIYYKKKNYALAADQLLFSVRNRNPQAEHYYRLGLAYYAKGDVQQARQVMKKALDLNATFPGADEARRIFNQKG